MISLPPTIKADITHGSYPGMRWAEIKIPTNATVEELKEKLYRHVGTEPGCMDLCVCDPITGNRIPLRDPTTTTWVTDLSGLQIDLSDRINLHIEDSDKSSAVNLLRKAYEADLHGDSKYVIPDEVYNQRADTARNFIRSLKATGMTDTENRSTKENSDTVAPKVIRSELHLKFPIGSRCSVSPGDRRGDVKFIGMVSHKDNKGVKVWRIGISLDEPLGDSNGSDPQNPSKSLFECKSDNYGLLASPSDVEIGDFPPIDPFELDEI